jgi:predicted RNase H-like nuclease (RuvC/YqgF family)
MNMNTTLSVKETSSSFILQLIQEQLDGITRHMESEALSRQLIIERQHAEIQMLRKQLSEKNHSLSELRQALHECRQNADGHQQLVNKLLNDISGYQNDLDWYKRTYEKRSLLGTIRQKLFNNK